MIINLLEGDRLFSFEQNNGAKSSPFASTQSNLNEKSRSVREPDMLALVRPAAGQDEARMNHHWWASNACKPPVLAGLVAGASNGAAASGAARLVSITRLAHWARRDMES